MKAFGVESQMTQPPEGWEQGESEGRILPKFLENSSDDFEARNLPDGRFVIEQLNFEFRRFWIWPSREAAQADLLPKEAQP